MKTFRSFVGALLLSCLPAFGQAISSVGTIPTNTIGVFLDTKHLKAAGFLGGVTYDGVNFTFGVGTNNSIVGINGTQVSGPNWTNTARSVIGNVGTNVFQYPTNITDAEIAVGAAVARAKLANGTADHIVINSVGGVMTSEATLGATRFPALTGDITTPGGSLATSLAANSVTDTKLRDSAGFSVIGKFNTGTGDPADIVAGTDTVFGRIGSGNLGFAKVNTNQISGANASAGQVLGFDGSIVVWTNAPGGSGGSSSNLSFNGVLPSGGTPNVTNSSSVTWTVGTSNATAVVAASGIVDSMVNASGITTRSKLPTPIAYEDEDNSLSGSNLFTGALRITGSYQWGWTDLGASTNINGATNALFKILTGNLILTNSIRDNESVRLNITQDATGSRTLSIDNVSGWIDNTNQSSTMPGINTNGGRFTIVDVWRVNGTNYGTVNASPSVYSAALNAISPASTGGQLIGFNTNSATPTLLSMAPGGYISNSLVYAGTAGSSSGGTNYTFDTNQFSLGAGNTNLSLKTGALATNLNLAGGPLVITPTGTDSTNINWSVGQYLIQGITTNASFTNKFTGTNPVAGSSVSYVVNNTAGTNISVIFDSLGAIGLTNYYYNTGTSNATSVTVGAGTRTTFVWFYDGGRYYVTTIGKDLKVTDAAFSSAWDGDTGTAPSRNATYDYFHLLSTNDSGRVTIIDTRVGITNSQNYGVDLRGVTTNNGAIVHAPVTLAYSGQTNVAWDLSQGNVATLTLTNANPGLLYLTGFTNSTAQVGTWILQIKQDGSGSRSMIITNSATTDGHSSQSITTYTNANGITVLTLLGNAFTNNSWFFRISTNM